MPREFRYVASVKADYREFAPLWEAATTFATGSDRWAEIQAGYLAFHFESAVAHLQFCSLVTNRKLELVTSEEAKATLAKTIPTPKFVSCRELVREDAVETQIACRFVIPLLEGALRKIKTDYVHGPANFLRRAITRYLALALCRLLDKANEKGKTGITASIEALMEMSQSEGVLSAKQIEKFTSELAELKRAAAAEEYDLVAVLFELRNVELAHRLIPWRDPTEQLLAHHLLEFAEGIFGFVVKLDAAIAQATGTKLDDLEVKVDGLSGDAEQFWNVLTSADDE